MTEESERLVSFNIESWSAIAPSLHSEDAWQKWLQRPWPLPKEAEKVALPLVPPMLRRRLNQLGKYTAAVSMEVLAVQQKMVTIFASRHGDTDLTLALLKQVGRDEALSPTGFSLSVHNAVSGLLSIARQDTLPSTAIAAMQGLVFQTLCEGISQLQQHQNVLCVITDIPLPDIYQSYCEGQDFPYALAFIMSREGKQPFTLEHYPEFQPHVPSSDPAHDDIFALMEMLCGGRQQISFCVNGSYWKLQTGCSKS